MTIDIDLPSWSFVAATLILAIAWHVFVTNRSQDVLEATEIDREATLTQQQERLLKSRLLVLPNDLVLEETVETRQYDDRDTKDTKATDIPRLTEEDSDQTTPHTASAAVPESLLEESSEPLSSGPSSVSDPEDASPPVNNDNIQSTATKEPSSPTAAPAHAPFSSTASKDHPGLNGFWHWWDVETSLFRIYAIGRTDGVEVVPPYNPSSRRGIVQVALEITNDSEDVLQVDWIDYKGAAMDKGRIEPWSTWYQTTWIDHPWVIRCGEHIVLHYIPYRVIPTTAVAPTVDANGVGRHRFTIRAAKDDSPLMCSVDDPIFPFPASDHFRTVSAAIQATLLHCHRMDYRSWLVPIKYLTKIVSHPEQARYRQIRTGNRVFANSIWNTPARGLFLAVGFVEHGPYVELGTAEPLPRERVQEMAHLLLLLSEWQEYSETAGPETQPPGADGYGRAGFGRAGGMS